MIEQELRRSFNSFWSQNGFEMHGGFPVATSDPTVMFVNAGITPYKPQMLSGAFIKPSALIQNCLRTHWGEASLYRFEMMSLIGMADRFQTAIDLMFEFLISKVGLYKGSLHCVCDPQDILLHSACTRWLEPDQFFYTKGNTDKYWTRWKFDEGSRMLGRGNTLVWRFEERAPCSERCDVWCTCNRYMSLGNFITVDCNFHRKAYFDIGFGFERLASIDVGGDTSLLPSRRPLNQEFGNRIGNREDGQEVANLMRAISLLIAEAVEPSNKRHGYILRRMIRIVINRMYSIDHATVHLRVEELLEVYRLCSGDPLLKSHADSMRSVFLAETYEYLGTISKRIRMGQSWMEIRSRTSQKSDISYLKNTFGLPMQEILALLKIAPTNS